MKIYTYNRDVHNVMCALRPLFAVGKLLGVFRFRYKNNQLIPVDGKMKCAVMCIIGFYCSIWFAFMCIGPSSDGLLSSYLVYLTVILTAVYYILTLIIQSITDSPVNVQILYFLAKIDLKLDSCVRNNFYNRLKRYALCIVILLFLITLSFSLWYYFIFEPVILLAFMIDSVMFLQDIETILVCIFVIILKLRLTTINQNLENLVNESCVSHICYTAFNNSVLHKPKWIKNARDTIKSSFLVKLRDQSIAYSFIGKTCGLINNLYSFQILIVLLSSFTFVILTLVAFLEIFRSEISVNNLICLVTWCGSRLIYVMMLCFICESLLKTRNNTKVLVNALVMDYELPANVRAQAKAFMQLIDAWPLRIHVYNMFSVDISLLLKFIGVCTTYLIILIQIL